mmetsp:Transcript_9109/g.11350  ORF Transcript_9109/g.11350 Transcript_9109/m.11350 type:complete len:152 (+) Transcript_9109:155-610(+)
MVFEMFTDPRVKHFLKSTTQVKSLRILRHTAPSLLAKIEEKHFVYYKSWAQEHCASTLIQCMDESGEKICNDSLDADFELLSDGDMEVEEAIVYTLDMRKDADAVVDKCFMHKVNFVEVTKQQNTDFDEPMGVKTETASRWVTKCGQDLQT